MAGSATQIINGWVGDANFTAGIQYIVDNGSLHFNSAGNGSELNPARQAFEQTLLVASTTSTDTLSSFSNFGTGVDIAAPGSDILSTVAGNRYEFFSGTSMATPNAAGVAALIWSANPSWNSYQVAAQLVGTADNIDAQNPSFVGLLGGGRVNSFKALTGTLAPPRVDGTVGVPANGLVTENTGISSFSVEFDKILDPLTANNAANYELRHAGNDGVFDTTDDETYAIAVASDYMVGSNDVDLEVVGGSSLEVGDYRLTVISGGITDPFGTPLDGNGDGVAGGNFETFFSVVNPFKSVGPQPGLITARYDGGATLSTSTDEDIVRFFAESDETVTAIATPTNGSAALTLELVGVPGAVVSGAAGQSVLLDVTSIPADGMYEFKTSGNDGTTYQLDIYRNAVADGLIESTSAYSLDSSALNLGSIRYAAVAQANGSTGAPTFHQYSNSSLFVDISSTGTSLGLTDDGTAVITSTVGNALLGAGTMTIGNNGVVAAGNVAVGFQNEPVPSADFAAALMPFWDDIHVGAGDVYWEERQVDGVNTLIVQWDDRPHYNNVGSATFQLQLFESGPVLARYAYADVDFGNASFNGGASATIGYQFSAGNGAQFSFDTNVLSNGDVIDIENLPPTTDQDDFEVDLTNAAGQRVDVILAGDTSDFGNATLELLDPSGTVVATGTTGSSSYDQGILDFAVTTPGVHTVRVSANLSAKYYLVVTDGLAYDSEPNNVPSASLRNITTLDGAFGFLGSGDTGFTQSANASAFIDISSTGTSLPLSDDGEANITTSVGNDLAPAGAWTIGNNGLMASGSNVAIDFSNAALPNSDFDVALAPFWDDIHDTAGSVYWQETVVNGINALIVQWDDRPHYNNVGNATFQVQVFESGPVPIRYAYQDVDFGDPAFSFGASATIGYQVSSTSGTTYSLNSAVLANGDIIDITAKENDVFKVDFADGEVATFVTSTPFDDPSNEPRNLLDPDLEILDAGGNVLAFDANSAGDGKNARVTFTAPAAGAYFVSVVGAGGTGEYVLLRSGTTIDGDFNDDGAYDCLDADELVANIASGVYSASFDLISDGVLDSLDLDAWLAVAADANSLSSPYRYGDANLDGVVDVSDFNIWNGNKFTLTAAWCAGDFTADGVVDVSDLNLYISNKFTVSAAVPTAEEFTLGHVRADHYPAEIATEDVTSFDQNVFVPSLSVSQNQSISIRQFRTNEIDRLFASSHEQGESDLAFQPWD